MGFKVFRTDCTKVVFNLDIFPFVCKSKNESHPVPEVTGFVTICLVLT